MKLVLIALADNANDQCVCWPSIDYLAAKCDLSRQGVLNQIESLIGIGLLKVRKNDGKVNVYELLVRNQSTPLTRQAPIPVNAVKNQSTPLTTPVNPVDPNHKEPSLSKPSKKRTGRFQPPTLSEAKAKALEMGMPEREGEKFFSYYESNGWKVGKNPMKSWPSAMVTWRGKFEERNGPCRRPVTEREDDHEARYGYPRGTVPLSQRPPPGEDEKGNEITPDDWEARFPIHIYDQDK